MSDIMRMFKKKAAELKKRYDDYSEQRMIRAVQKAGEEDLQFREEAYRRVAEEKRKADKLNCGKGLFLYDVMYKK